MDKCSHCYIIDRAKTAYCPDCKKVKKTSQDISTVDVLDKIRDEIEQSRYGLVNDGLDLALKIIDKYRKDGD